MTFLICHNHKIYYNLGYPLVDTNGLTVQGVQDLLDLHLNCEAVMEDSYPEEYEDGSWEDSPY